MKRNKRKNSKKRSSNFSKGPSNIIFESEKPKVSSTTLKIFFTDSYFL